eukprot:UN21258
MCAGINIRKCIICSNKNSFNFHIVYMYHFKRYQKTFTFFVSRGYMKFPNLIVRIILDFNKIYLYVKI